MGFHFKLPGFAGGFIGVDVFFVISGFLITSIIFRRFESQQFSLGAFYLSRCRRIIPALFFLGLVLGLVLVFALSSPEFLQFSKHLASSLTFISNFVYQSESGYFDTGAYSKWLLHTWSLSIEWQFYILYPIVLIAFRDTWHLTAMRWGVLCLFLLSLFASLYMSATDPNNVFFMPHARAWEFLVGALVFFFPL